MGCDGSHRTNRLSRVGPSGQVRGLSEATGQGCWSIGKKPCKLSPKSSVRGRGQKSSREEWSRERGSIHSTKLSRKKGSKLSICLKYFKWKLQDELRIKIGGIG